MRIVASLLGVLAGFMFIAPSGAMNWMFMTAQGKTPLEGQILGMVSIAVDAGKTLLPFFIAAAWAHRQWLRTLLGAGAFALFFTFSLLSALGFVATNRDATASSRAVIISLFQLASKEIEDTGTRLAALGITRPEGEIKAEIDRLKQDRHWRSPQVCEDTRPRASRNICAQMFALDGELARAAAAQELRERIETLKQEIKRLQDRGSGEDKDPQAGFIAHLSGLKLLQAQQILNAFMAVLIEIGAASMLYLAMGSDVLVRQSGAQARTDIEHSKIEMRQTPPLAGEPQGEERFRLPASGRILLFG
jgi:hypothetical protein